MKKPRNTHPRQLLNQDKWVVKGAFASLGRVFYGTDFYERLKDMEENALLKLQILHDCTNHYDRRSKHGRSIK